MSLGGDLHGFQPLFYFILFYFPDLFEGFPCLVSMATQFICTQSAVDQYYYYLYQWQGPVGIGFQLICISIIIGDRYRRQLQTGF